MTALLALLHEPAALSSATEKPARWPRISTVSQALGA